MKQTILIMILFLFSNMLRLFSCLSCFDIPLLPFIQSFESCFTARLLGKAKACPPNVLHFLVIIIMIACAGRGVERAHAQFLSCTCASGQIM